MEQTDSPTLYSAYEALQRERPKYVNAALSPHHKVRSIWFQQRTAWPYREPSVEQLITERTRAHATLRDVPTTAQWESVGPTNIGGRMTCVVNHPTNADVVWVGAAGGGVWMSLDAGRSWRALWHQQPTLNIGALAIDPQNPTIVYCGTGESNLSADSYAGVGLFRSTNGGDSWLLLAPSATTGIPTRISTIAIDPSNPLHMLLGGIGFASDTRSGMFVSRDGGTTWARDNFVSPSNYWCHAIVFNPHDPHIIFIAVTAQGSKSGLWRSTDGGQTWTHLSQGLPFPASFGRTNLALAPSDPTVLYAQAAQAAARSRLLGVFRSHDAGDTWENITGTHFVDERQMSYNNAIVVHPTNPNHVLCGGVDLHLTTDGGAHWSKVTDWRKSPGDADYAHSDHHALLMPVAFPGRVYDVNDGGVDVSDDGGRTWSNRSNGLAVTMFYDVDIAQSNRQVFGGGCQDNGTQVTLTGASDAFQDITGGDGGWIIFDPSDELHIFASIYNLNIFRHRRPHGWVDISPPALPEEKEAIWMCFLEVSPADPTTLVAGSTRVWRTTNDGATWQPVSDHMDNSPITAVAIAPSDPGRVYIGTQNGGFFRSTDGGDTWSSNLAGDIPGHTITRIDTRPDDPDLVVLCVANTGHSHVFLSDDGGLTWRDIDQGHLPDVPHHALLIPPDAPTSLYVGNDAGVFLSRDLGQTWMTLTRNLPTTMIVDLVYHMGDGTLTAATYGRSLWRINVR